MSDVKWDRQKVQGRDEVLRDAQQRASAYRDRTMQDLRDLMNDYEVDIYRIIMAIGRRYGMDIAYEIMSETVTEKRLKWLDQKNDLLTGEGTDLARAFDLFVNYFRPAQGDLEVIENSSLRIVFKRKEFVTAISHACRVLGLDLMEVSNKVYGRATDRMFERINPKLRHVFRDYNDGWYEEAIEMR